MTRVSAYRSAALVSLLFLLGPRLQAQKSPEAQPAMFVNSNDKFGMTLLNTVHGENPDRNIAIAPLPVSLTFAALLEGSSDSTSSKEILSTFQWEMVPNLSAAGRMLIARFEKPKPYPIRRPTPPKVRDDPNAQYFHSGKPQEMWLSIAFLYRGKGSLSQDFIDRVKYSFGFEFRAVGDLSPQSAAIARTWDPSLPMPAVAGLNDFWITSSFHLRDSWAGNTFVESKREKQDFTVRSGNIVKADFLKSEFFTYPYVHTEDFEAVVLSCWNASLLLVLPGEGKDIDQLEAEMAKDPAMAESQLERRPGDIQMPPFHFSFEGNLGIALKRMGVHRIFNDVQTLISMAPTRSGGRLQGVAQKTEITVDENGIRADSGTIAHGIFGGIMSGQETSFHMILNRPFLFIIRDKVTNTLLFNGVVVNPLLQ